MNQSDKEEITRILQKIKTKGIPISGGIGRQSFVLRDPDVYWELGTALCKAAERAKINNLQRREWVRKHAGIIEKEILGEAKEENRITVNCFEYVDNLQDKEHFMWVVDLAGHKFGKFRLKVLDYIYDIYSKKNPSGYSESKKNQLAEKLLQREYTHKEINKILSDFKGRKKFSPELGKSYLQLKEDVDHAISGNEGDRRKLREEIGLKMIDILRTLFQLLQIQNDSIYIQTYNEVKNEIQSRISTKYNPAKIILEVLKKCANDEDARKKIHNKINSFEMGELQTQLRALEKEDYHKEFIETRDSFDTMFS